MRIIEWFTQSKSGDESSNDDGIFVVDDYVAVIDGATAKTLGKIGGTSSGRFAMLAVKKAFESVVSSAAPATVIRTLNSEMNRQIEKLSEKPSEPPLASVIYYNDSRKEIVSYGDCMCAINGTEYKQVKKTDTHLALKRAEIIKRELARGVPPEEIRRNDVGRRAIINELKNQATTYANNPDGGFPCINGGEPVENYLRVYHVKHGDIVELASDGYPTLCGSLASTEAALHNLLEKDILCINELCSTKCVALGNVSFDDRSYVKFEV